MKHVLVTGSSGQLGREIVRQLREGPYHVTGVDVLPAPTTDRLLDIRDKAQVFAAARGIDAIIHTAAVHGKQYALNYPRGAFTGTNIDGTLHLLEACVAHGIRKFLYTSTTSIYGHAMSGDREAIWVDEALPPDPRDIYDITKLAAELLCRDFFEKEGVQATVLRVSRFLPEPDNTIAVHRLYRGLDERDGAAAHLLALEKTFDRFQVFNVSAKSPFGKADLAGLKTDPKAVIKKYYPDVEQVFAARQWTFPQSIDRVYVVDKAERQLGYAPQYNFREYLEAGERVE
jgi:nucleoside-diphosphate-sugar epimerase